MQETKAIVLANKGDSFPIQTAIQKMEQVKESLDLLDTAFTYYLNIIGWMDEGKQRARESMSILLAHWKFTGHSVSLKAHVMEKHVCTYNENGVQGIRKNLLLNKGISWAQKMTAIIQDSIAS